MLRYLFVRRFAAYLGVTMGVCIGFPIGQAVSQRFVWFVF